MHWSYIYLAQGIQSLQVANSIMSQSKCFTCHWWHLFPYHHVLTAFDFISKLLQCVGGYSWRSKATYIRQSWQPQQRGHLHQEYLPNVIAQFLLPTWCSIAQARRKDSKVCKIVIEHIVENNIVATILRNDVYNVFINTYRVMPL